VKIPSREALFENGLCAAHQMLIGLVLDQIHLFPGKEIAAFVYDEHDKARSSTRECWVGLVPVKPDPPLRHLGLDRPTCAVSLGIPA
jgi:hypothetical protein